MQFSSIKLNPKQSLFVLRFIMSLIYPHLKESADCILPHEARFAEWRRYVYPILRHWNLAKLSKLGVNSTLCHDASSKFIEHEKRSIFQASLKTMINGVSVMSLSFWDPLFLGLPSMN
jgi:hypothetical protein